MHLLIEVVSLGIAAGVAAFTITKTTITQPFRTWLGKTKPNAKPNSVKSWFYKLFGCPYCLSHWLCAIAVLIYRPRFLDQNIVLDLGVTWLVMVFVASLTFGWIIRQIKALVA